jgi:MFS family permease
MAAVNAIPMSHPRSEAPMMSELPGEARTLLLGRGLRAFADGFVAILLPVYLLALGHDVWNVGVISTATLLGSSAMTIAVGRWGHRFVHPRLLLCAAALMAATGLAFAGLSDFGLLMGVAVIGTLNPSAGDVSVFLPLEHARLAHLAHGAARTRLFALYSLAGALCAAFGSLAAALPDIVAMHGIDRLGALRAMFAIYAAIGISVWVLYRRLPRGESMAMAATTRLVRSRRNVARLAALFSLDAFAGGLLVQSLLALWLFERFDLSLPQAASFFFWTALLSACSQLAAPRIAARIGLLNTMVFTHIPSSIALIGAALATRMDVALGLLLVRAALSQMDVPTRSAYVMALVEPGERTAAASYVAVPRSLAASISPSITGALLAAGWFAAPLVACGALKIAYDVALLITFRNEPIEEQG